MLRLFVLLAALAPLPAFASPPEDKAPPEGVPNQLPAPGNRDLIDEKASAFKEASELLTRAGQARTRGQAWFAEQLFSAAELLVGPEALAQLAPLFRAQSPERVQGPIKHFGPDAPVQPPLAGSSDEDEPPAPAPELGTLSGVLRLEGKTPVDGIGVVTLEPVEGKARAPRPRHRIMEQRDRQFRPHILVVPVGSTVTFPNFDPIYHNVFSRSTARAFDLGLFKSGDGREITFDKPGVIKLGCNLHLNMTGYVVVVSSPRYAVTDAKGHFAFKNLQPGRYTLRAWSETRAEPQVQTVTIKPDKNSVVVHLTGAVVPDTVTDKFGVVRPSKPW
jgi:plastocyanin